MAFTNINAATPLGSDKGKVLDNEVRDLKAAVKSNLAEISNYQVNNVQPTVVGLRTPVWDTAGRPAEPGLVDRVSGYNSDHGCVEYYDNAESEWYYLSGQGYWNIAGRPASPPIGLIGFNYDLWVTERWDGSAWQRLSGGQRGDIKAWSGAVADIATKNPGWVLADGSERTIDGATFTVPDLRGLFLVGAGSSYEVGATGGEAAHTLTVDEMPSHAHQIYATNTARYGGDVYDLGNNVGVAGALAPKGYLHEGFRKGFKIRDASKIT
jgi:hypothetical protein